VTRGGLHTAPSCAAEKPAINRKPSPLPFISRRSPRQNHASQRETLNFKPETRPPAAVPHNDPPFPALYGLFRAKKIKKYFRNLSSRRDNRKLASHEVAGSTPVMRSVLKGRRKTPTVRNTMLQSFSLKPYWNSQRQRFPLATLQPSTFVTNRVASRRLVPVRKHSHHKNRVFRSIGAIATSCTKSSHQNGAVFLTKAVHAKMHLCNAVTMKRCNEPPKPVAFRRFCPCGSTRFLLTRTAFPPMEIG
jgi:hypothetical protein